jgi:SAM-dependent methyltransferase
LGTLRWWPTVDVPEAPPPDLGATSHRSRRALDAVLRDDADESAWRALAGAYDAMAAEWTDWVATQDWYLSPLQAGLAHVTAVGPVVEVGCGTGQAVGVLSQHATQVFETDVNLSMLLRSPSSSGVCYVAADVRRMPFRTGSVSLVVGLNAVPYVGEFRRILGGAGQVLWCSSFGDRTPLYVSPETLQRLFGPAWTADAGRAGHGEWVLLSPSTD